LSKPKHFIQATVGQVQKDTCLNKTWYPSYDLV